MDSCIRVSIAPYKYKRSNKCRKIRSSCVFNNFIISIDEFTNIVNISTGKVINVKHVYVFYSTLIYTTPFGEIYINDELVATDGAASLKFEKTKFILIVGDKTVVRDMNMKVVATISHNAWVSSSHDKISVFYNKKTYYYANSGVLLHVSSRRFVCWNDDVAIETDQRVISYNDIGKYLQLFAPLTDAQHEIENSIIKLLDSCISGAVMIYAVGIDKDIPVELVIQAEWDQIALNSNLNIIDTTCAIPESMFTHAFSEHTRLSYVVDNSVRAKLLGAYMTNIRETISHLYTRVCNNGASFNIDNIVISDNVTYNAEKSTLRFEQSKVAKNILPIIKTIYKHGLVVYFQNNDAVFGGTNRAQIMTQREFVKKWEPYLELVNLPTMYPNSIIDCTNVITAINLIDRMRADFKLLNNYRQMDLPVEQFMRKLLL